MICAACRDRHHENCRGGSWCDCQHQDAAVPADLAEEAPLNWVRQG